MYNLDNIVDNRTEQRARADFEASRLNEEIMMKGLAAEMYSRGHDIYSVDYEKIDPTEQFNDGRYHASPDYYFTAGQGQCTFEIKSSPYGTFYGQTVYVKKHSILSMVEDPKLYPNGKLIVGTSTWYAVMKAKDIVDNYDKDKVFEEFSTRSFKKTGFMIPESDLIKRKWDIRLVKPSECNRV